MSYTVKIVTGCRIVKSRKWKLKNRLKLVSMFEKRIVPSPLLLHPLQGSSCPGVDLLPFPLHWAPWALPCRLWRVLATRPVLWIFWLLVPYSENLLLDQVASSSKKAQIFQKIIILDSDNKVFWFINFFLVTHFCKSDICVHLASCSFHFFVRMPIFQTVAVPHEMKISIK